MALITTVTDTDHRTNGDIHGTTFSQSSKSVQRSRLVIVLHQLDQTYIITIKNWLVWRWVNGVRHINKVTLRRTRLVSGLVTTYGRSTIPVYLSRPLRPTQPGHPSVGRCNEYRRWFRPSLGRNGASEVTTLWRYINQCHSVSVSP